MFASAVVLRVALGSGDDMLCLRKRASIHAGRLGDLVGRPWTLLNPSAICTRVFLLAATTLRSASAASTTAAAFPSAFAFLPVALAALSRDLPFSRCGKLPPRDSLPCFKVDSCRSFAAAFSTGSMAPASSALPGRVIILWQARAAAPPAGAPAGAPYSPSALRAICAAALCPSVTPIPYIPSYIGADLRGWSY